MPLNHKLFLLPSLSPHQIQIAKLKDKVFQNIDENDKEVKNIKEKMNDFEDSVSKLTNICF